jgi:hypothetical protein
MSRAMDGPVWGFSATAGLISGLLGANLLVNSETNSGIVLVVGSFVLFAWALWLSHRES